MMSDPMDPEAPQSQSQSPLLRDERRKGSATPYIKPPQSGFDPYQCPPDFDLAISHGQAKRVYQLTAQSAKQRLAVLDKEVCPCCGLPKHGKLLPLRAKLSELYHLGSGYPLYFKLTKRCAVLLALIFVTSGLFDLISNAAAGDCSSPDDDATSDDLCVRNMITIGTIANKKDHPGLLTAQMALTLVSMIVIMVYTQVTRYQLRKTHIEADDATVTPADYTIKVTGVDPELSDDDIRDWIEGIQTPERKIKSRKINRTYNITHYTELRKKKDMLEVLKRQVHSEEKKQKLLIEAETTEIRLKQLTDAGLKPTHTVLITFEKAEQAAYIIEEFSKGRERTWYEYFKAFIGTSAYTFNGKVVFIERAPEPTDILWQNLGHSSWEKFKKRSYTRIVAAFIIAISFAVIVVINWGQGKATTSDKFNFFTITLLSGLGSIMIVVINVMLAFVTKNLAHHEKHGSYTSYFTGVAEKLSVSQLINTAFTTMLAEIVLYNHFKEDSSLEGGLESASFYGEGGLLQDMFYVFISNAFLTPVLNYFDIGYFLKLHNRKKALKQGTNSTMTQQEAQTLFEEPEMDLAVNHSWLISTVLLSGFYAPAVPAALIFGCAGIILGYWVDKYLLLRRNIYPIALQNELSNQMLLSLEWMGAVMGIGNLFFVGTLKNSNGDYIYNVVPKGLTWLILALGLLLAFLPTKALNERFFPLIDEVTENYTYDAIKAEFATDYKIQNPVTNKEGLHEQAETLKRKKVLIPKIRKNLRLGAHLLFTEKHFTDTLKNKKVKQRSGEEGEEDSVIHSDMSQQSSLSGDTKPLIPSSTE